MFKDISVYNTLTEKLDVLRTNFSQTISHDMVARNIKLICFQDVNNVVVKIVKESKK